MGPFDFNFRPEWILDKIELNDIFHHESFKFFNSKTYNFIAKRGLLKGMFYKIHLLMNRKFHSLL